MSPHVLRRATLVALLLTLLTAAPALAHTSLVKSTPAAGAVLPTAPTTISLTFGEAVTLPPDPLQITGPGGAAWTVGKATIDDATVSFPVTATGPAGAYTMAWQVIADDGDTVKGTVPFTLSAPATPPTTAAPATAAAAPTTAAAAAPPTTVGQQAETSSGGVPAWVWVVVVVVVVAAIAGWVVRSRRRA
jgi:hypothetical protein